MSVTLVRQESNTPNIQNHDDVRAFRFAGCGINGVVKGYLNELGYEVNGNTLTLKSGEIILFGWQVKVDASGENISVTNISGTQYYSVYAEIDISAGEKKAAIKSTYNTASYPVIEVGDDISVKSVGVARLELYRFTASSGVIGSVQKRFELLDGTAAKALQANLSTYSETSGNSTKINNLEIKKDGNGVLKVGDIIISQRERLAGGAGAAAYLVNEQGKTEGTINLIKPINEGDILEIEYIMGYLGEDSFNKSVKIRLISREYYYFTDVLAYVEQKYVKPNIVQVYSCKFDFHTYKPYTSSQSKTITVSDFKITNATDGEESALKGNLAILAIYRIIE